MARRPPPDVDVGIELATELVRRQAPELADRPLAPLSSGWDNVLFRLGPDLIVRLPHRAAPAALIAHEQEWLPRLAPVLEPVCLPLPVVVGSPDSDLGYPYGWSIVEFHDGADASQATFDQEQMAEELGSFYAALHQPAPADAPVNEFRSGPVRDRRPHFEQRLGTLGDRVDASALLAVFAAAERAPEHSEPCWVHGDLHPRNVIVDDGQLTAVIDWIDITQGDPAVDLAAAHMLVPDELPRVRACAAADDAAWARAAGWAVHFGVTYLAMSDDDPVMAGIGSALLEHLTALAK